MINCRFFCFGEISKGFPLFIINIDNNGRIHLVALAVMAMIMLFTITTFANITAHKVKFIIFHGIFSTAPAMAHNVSMIRIGSIAFISHTPNLLESNVHCIPQSGRIAENGVGFLDVSGLFHDLNLMLTAVTVVHTGNPMCTWEALSAR